jgi:hypothetical protein
MQHLLLIGFGGTNNYICDVEFIAVRIIICVACTVIIAGGF